MRRRPDRTTLTPWRIGALLQPRRPRTGRSRVVNTRPWPRGSVSVVARGLGPGPLLDHDELAALVVRPRLVEPDHHLQREHEVAVEVAVQGVPVAGAVPEEQRGRAGLAGGVAPVQPVVERLGPRGVMAAPGRPLAGDGQQTGARTRRAGRPRGSAAGARSTGTGRRRSGAGPCRRSTGSGGRRRRGRPAHGTGRRPARARWRRCRRRRGRRPRRPSRPRRTASSARPVDVVRAYLGVHGHARPTPRPPSP